MDCFYFSTLYDPLVNNVVIFRAIIKWREKIRKDEAPKEEKDADVEMVEEEEEDEEVISFQSIVVVL